MANRTLNVPPGYTAATGLSEQQRSQQLGYAFSALTLLLALITVQRVYSQLPEEQVQPAEPPPAPPVKGVLKPSLPPVLRTGRQTNGSLCSRAASFAAQSAARVSHALRSAAPNHAHSALLCCLLLLCPLFLRLGGQVGLETEFIVPPPPPHMWPGLRWIADHSVSSVHAGSMLLSPGSAAGDGCRHRDTLA